ncbi:uncharacterized protein N7479_008195 [Penicillium vulpinum]|uniref:uncharacterized protein n=1 Tax=Penicillium vulpinum TaxID=29845 RepID=UPI0025473CCE|nr:uncharacterized protein N7479_008195 [Penicillium vulpinum]KAJ5961045.1 hypothetical protein N7479_008195 [Penicillium vulpinum]
MANVSLLSLPNELIYQIASDMCVRDIISLIQCYPTLRHPLLWLCEHKRKKQELQGPLTACIQTDNADGVRLLLSVNADIEYIGDNTNDRPKRSTDRRNSGYYWNGSNVYWALKNNNQEMVEACLAHLAQMKMEIPRLSVDSVEKALHFAARNHYTTVRLLVDLGAHCNLTDAFHYYDSHKPILLALFKCSSIFNSILKLLVETGADVSSEDVLHGFIATSNRCTFSNEETAKLLVEHGASAGVRDYIARAVMNKNNKKALIELLVACGLIPDKTNGWGRVPVNVFGPKETFEDRALLIKQLLELDANIRHRTFFGPALLQSGNSNGSKTCESESETEQTGDETCLTFIHKSVKLLLGYRTDGKIGDSEQRGPLHQADNRGLVKLILAHGAEVNVVDSYSQMPLHTITYGASKATVETIKLLLKHGADISAKNADDNTPLHLAVLTSSWEVVKLLLDHGADRNSRNLDGEIPMDLLARRRSHREQFSLNRENRRGLICLKTFKFVDSYWRGWQTYWAPPPFYGY